MNAPVRFESLFWMASPLLAWAQAGTDARPGALPETKPSPAPARHGSRPRRKRRKAVA